MRCQVEPSKNTAPSTQPDSSVHTLIQAWYCLPE